jgi:murein DD-endopeptidase MepM/ murein hydrolase activator NlpD
MKTAVLLVLALSGALLGAQGLVYPIQGWSWQSSGFGDRQNPMGGGSSGWHAGLDLACKVGTPIVAVGDGEVVSCYLPPKRGRGGDRTFGGMIVLRTTYRGIPVYVRYGHLSAVWVREGQTYQAGDVIGLSGSTGVSTGPHLHFEVLLDPLPALGWERQLWEDRR